MLCAFTPCHLMFIKLIFMYNLMLFSFVSLTYGFNNQKQGLCYSNNYIVYLFRKKPLFKNIESVSAIAQQTFQHPQDLEASLRKLLLQGAIILFGAGKLLVRGRKWLFRIAILYFKGRKLLLRRRKRYLGAGKLLVRGRKRLLKGANWCSEEQIGAQRSNFVLRNNKIAIPKG